MGFFNKIIEKTLNVATAPVRATVATGKAIEASVDGDRPTKAVAKSVKYVVDPEEGDFCSFTGTLDDE